MAQILLAVFSALFILVPKIAEACPGCNTLEDGTVGFGFNASVYFMMAMPFFVAGSVIVGIKIIKRKNSENKNQDEESEN